MADLKFKPAKVTLEREKFMLSVGATKKQIAVGEINDAASVRKLVGKRDVEVALSGRTIVAIGRRVAPCYWIVCYVPVPDLFRKILPELRAGLVDKYVAAGVIEREFAQELKGSF